MVISHFFSTLAVQVGAKDCKHTHFRGIAAALYATYNRGLIHSFLSDSISENYHSGKHV